VVLEKHRFASLIWLKSLNFSRGLFRRGLTAKQFFCLTKPFPALAQTSGNSGWLSSQQRNGGQRRLQTGDSQMRTLSFILAFAFVLAPSVAGLSDTGLPGIGTFAYGGSPIATSASQVVVVAAK
jgi:hypothetical protein